MLEPIQIRCQYALGDVVVLTAAVRDLVRSYPGRFRVSVRSGSPDVWRHNPYVHQGAFPGRVIDCTDALIDRSGATGRHYVHTYLDLLNSRLGTNAEISEVRGDIHLSHQERNWFSDIWNLCGREVPYWLVCSGGKFDIPVKWWNHVRYQQVVDAFRGRIQFVQVGAWGNHHPRLEGAIDLRGKTSVRDLIHLVHHADGVLCGVTSLMHLAAAVPARNPGRAAIVVAGNREPKSWEAYPGHYYLTAGDNLSCGNCWNVTFGPASSHKNHCDRLRNDLPECMDAVTSDRIIELISGLQRTGRIRFLSPNDKRFAIRAHKNAANAAVFDPHNITVQNSAEKVAQFLETIPPYARSRFSGRGIVICAGGVGYFTRAWVCIRMLRALGCTLPIEVWHYGKAELDDRMRELLAPMNVSCVDANRVAKHFPMRNPLGWELKCYSVLHSRFQEVLSLDADNVPVVNPEFLFNTPEYHRHGAIFWPDYGSLSPQRKIWKLCGVPYRAEPEFESGQMVINKETCWRALNLAWWYNDHSEFFFRFIHGDKDTFHLAWRRTDTPYAMVPFPIESLGGVMCQHDFQGRRIFQHRNSHKWSFFGENRRISGFLFEDECRAHLDVLRELWNGQIGGARETRPEYGVRFRLDTVDQGVFESVVLFNEYRLPNRFPSGNVIVDIGAHIGSFVRACHERGSREIHAFEPHPENFQLAKTNVGHLPGVTLHHAAVLDRTGSILHGEFTREIGLQNTGGASIRTEPGPIPSLGIDPLLRRLGYVQLLKLDCEGSEWPILSTLNEWSRIGAICGEFHLNPADPSRSPRILADLLRSHFRWVTVLADATDVLLGKFWASPIKDYFRNAHVQPHSRKGRPASGRVVF